MVMGLGLVGGCLLMTKVNLGFFYAMALGIALLGLRPAQRGDAGPDGGSTSSACWQPRAC